MNLEHLYMEVRQCLPTEGGASKDEGASLKGAPVGQFGDSVVIRNDRKRIITSNFKKP